ncbi:MAG: NAD(P)/FAD-dependent oxidoreductase [Bacteroidota bacterium]
MPDFEITVIGAGVVGLAIAAKLSQKHPNLVLLERNEKYGMETSSRNSEVIHAGIYYTPGSLKATLCVEGRELLYFLCQKHNIAHKRITKIITATNEAEREKLQTIYENGLKNGVELQLLNKQETLNLEPNINTVGSIFSPSTGVVSAHELMDHFYHTTLDRGGAVQHRSPVVGLEKINGGYSVTIDEQGRRSAFTSEIVVNAAGLGSDRVAALAGIDIDKAAYRLSFAKGSYFSVVPSKAKLLSRLVYPVPGNENLGVHALFDWGGRLKFGPDIEYVDGDRLDYSVSDNKRQAFAESIRRILPAINDEDLSPDMSGIRPKLQRKGEPARDFVIVNERERGLEGLVNLIGIESPGLTSSPAIAQFVEKILF